MDLSLWDPPICKDESFEFGGNIAENWLRSDFYYGYGLWDVIEEDALNEKACMEVLRREAKAGIEEVEEEVEEEIAMLCRPLALADEVLSKKCSTLKERIHSLSVLVLGVKNEEPRTENDLDFQNLGEYAGKLGVISRDLLGSYSPNTDSQNLGRATEKLTPTQSEEETNQNNFMERSCITEITEETDGPITAVKEAIEETFEDDVHDRGVELVQTTGVDGKELHESNLSLRSEIQSLTEKEEFAVANLSLSEVPSLTEKVELAVGSLVAPEPSLAMEMEHVIPLLKHLKRKLPCGQAGKSSHYKKNNKGICMKKGGKNNSTASDVTLDPVSQPPGKKRRCQSSPLLKKNAEMINQGILKMDETMASQLIKDEAENICSAALIELPSSTMSSCYDSLSLNRLREISKERKVKRYSKMKKCELIQALLDQDKQLVQASS